MFADQYKVGESQGQRATKSRRGVRTENANKRNWSLHRFRRVERKLNRFNTAPKGRVTIFRTHTQFKLAMRIRRFLAAVELSLDARCLTCDFASQMPTGHLGVPALPSATGNAPARAHGWRLNNPVDCSKALFPAERPDWAVIYGTARRGKSSAFGRAAQAARRAQGCGAA